MSEQEKQEDQVEESVEAAEEAAEMEAAAADSDEGDVIADLEAQVADLKDKNLRAAAEMENIRRRAEKQQSEAAAYAATSFARDMLSVLDNMDRAVSSLPEDIPEEVSASIEGIEMTAKEILTVFDKHGIKRVVPEIGEKFDHNLHQAMFEVPTEDHKPGCVMQVAAHGYVIKDRLLRPAMVGVSKAAPKVDTEA